MHPKISSLRQQTVIFSVFHLGLFKLIIKAANKTIKPCMSADDSSNTSSSPPEWC